MYLDYAEDQAEHGFPMSMNDWAQKLNAFLQFNQREILDNPGLVSTEIAKSYRYGICNSPINCPITATLSA